jgi:hypothetical protein
MPSRGHCVLLPILAAMAASMSALAEDQTPERHLVEAFRAYCVATAAEPARVRAAIETKGKLEPRGLVYLVNGGEIQSAEILPSSGRSDLHQRMLITYGRGLGDSGRKRSCQVNLPWGEKAKLVAELAAADLSLGDGTSTVVREGQFDTDLTRWTTRIGDKEAVVELGMPTYAGAAGRALTLSLEGP